MNGGKSFCGKFSVGIFLRLLLKRKPFVEIFIGERR